MKKLLTIFVFILTCSFINAQDESVAGELSIWVKNNPQNKTITLTLELVSPTCWDENHYITELFNGGTVGFSGYSNEGWLEFHVCWSTFPGVYYKTFGLGLYKITAKVNDVVKDHFFIDYRTSDLPEAIGVGCTIDYDLDFDVAAEKFYYRLTQDEFSDYHAFWDLRPCVDLITDGLEDHWENALAAIPQKNPSTGVFEPFLVWGPNNQISSPFVYQIYWRYGETGSFDLLKTVDANTTTTRHENLAAVGGGRQAYYKVRAYNNQGPDYSDFTNIANIGVGQFYGGHDKKNLYENISNNEYRLMQNYPNPFNPSTVISYQTPSDNFVSLKVFDVLGREVAELVNTYKEAGTHSVEFNASELSSGIYLYKIQIGSYIETRKLILQK